MHIHHADLCPHFRSLDPLEEETLTANESDEDMEIKMTAKTISPSNER
jgi:hypothetical protein